MESQKITTRPPIVVVLGHIDHGKSSLLEAIRDFKITSKESGGITQHIGAYQVEEKGKKITFLDTPGHEAFSQMRSRGAKVADIAILIVDAAEGVKPQTKEAILHIKKTGIAAIVALNKIDKPESDPEKIKRELSQEDFLVESSGGKIPSVNISAKNKKGISELLELILLTAEMEELKAQPEKSGEGVVIESHLDSLRGFTATLLLTDGHLKTGDIVGTNSAFTKIKKIEDFQKKSLEKAIPSDPVIIFGFNQSPGVGEKFKVFPDLTKAEDYLKASKEKEGKEKKEPVKVSEEDNQKKTLNLILKTDVLVSKEVVEGILNSLTQEKINTNLKIKTDSDSDRKESFDTKIDLKVLKSEVGNINESDIKLALAGQAIILGFRVKMDPTAKKVAEREKIKVITFEVIYDLVERVRKIMEKIVQPKEIRVNLGKLKVLSKFLTEKNRQIIGGKAIEGEIRKGSKIEVFREKQKIGQGKIINLQRNKKDAFSVSKGEECGILFEGNTAIEKGDILLFYVIEKVKRPT